jgi:hypothetical protein
MQTFYNDYFLVVHTNLNNIFEDYDLYLIDQHTGRAFFYATYYTLPELFLAMQNLYNTIRKDDVYEDAKAYTKVRG